MLRPYTYREYYCNNFGNPATMRSRMIGLQYKRTISITDYPQALYFDKLSNRAVEVLPITHYLSPMIIDRLSPDSSTPLWTKSQLELALAAQRLPEWIRSSYEAFTTVIRGEGFPCFFGTLAEQKEMMRYAIAPSLTDPETFEHILAAVYNYLEEETLLTERYSEEDALLLTLALFFPIEEEAHPVEYYGECAFAFLNELHQRDRAPWPAEIPTDPQEPGWCYCLGGRSFFVNICTPAHRDRRSRNLGPGLMMILNPDSTFQKLWGLKGEEPRHKIYQRGEKYDRIPPSPLLWPWHPQEERPLMYADISLLSDRNDVKLSFPFHFDSSKEKQSGCPFHSYSETLAKSQDKPS